MISASGGASVCDPAFDDDRILPASFYVKDFFLKSHSRLYSHLSSMLSFAPIKRSRLV
jgi:hypothetical protein